MQAKSLVELGEFGARHTAHLMPESTLATLHVSGTTVTTPRRSRAAVGRSAALDALDRLV